jgi:nucleotide-binding universal stress UspA family protein
VTAPDGIHDGGASANRAVTRLVPALLGGLDGFAATLGIANTRSVVRRGRPSEWLGYVAAASEAPLVVLGRRSNANRSRIGEPNVIGRVTRRTSASVLVVPEGVHAAPRSIVAAVDRSAVGEQVIATAGALAARFGYDVVILHVMPPTSGAYVRVIRRDDHPARHVERDRDQDVVPALPHWLLERTRLDSPLDGLRPRVVIGDPAREIMTLARSLGAAMIVTGKRGEDEAPRGSVGSVARELLAKASVPVLAVDDGARSQ